jgi:hypothetical protein
MEPCSNVPAEPATDDSNFWRKAEDRITHPKSWCDPLNDGTAAPPARSIRAGRYTRLKSSRPQADFAGARRSDLTPMDDIELSAESPAVEPGEAHVNRH